MVVDRSPLHSLPSIPQAFLKRRNHPPITDLGRPLVALLVHPTAQDHRQVTNLLLGKGGVPGSPRTHTPLVLAQTQEARAYEGPCPSDVTASAHPLAHPWPPPLPRLSPPPSYSPRVGVQSPSMKDPLPQGRDPTAGVGACTSQTPLSLLYGVCPKEGTMGQAPQGPGPPPVDPGASGGEGGADTSLPPYSSSIVPRPTLAPAGSLPCTTGFSTALLGLKGQPRAAPPSHQDSPRPGAPVLLLGCRH